MTQEHATEATLAPAIGAAGPAGQYLLFSLAGREYGLLLSEVREINRVCPVTPVPETPDYVEGLMNLRGRVIPVVDLRRRFLLEAQAYTKKTCIVVVETGEGQVGAVVDEVSGVSVFAGSAIETNPPLAENELRPFVRGLGRIEERVVILIDGACASAKIRKEAA